MKTKVYKVVFYAVDHDNLSPEDVKDVVENTIYPNRCLSPSVLSIDHREVEWSDDHPLNKRDTSRAALEVLFTEEPVLPICSLRDALEVCFPQGSYRLIKPLRDDGLWALDLSYKNAACEVVWSASDTWVLSDVSGDPTPFSQPDEVFQTMEGILARLVEMLKAENT